MVLGSQQSEDHTWKTNGPEGEIIVQLCVGTGPHQEVREGLLDKVIFKVRTEIQVLMIQVSKGQSRRRE
jgi:hypothetical protein